MRKTSYAYSGATRDAPRERVSGVYGASADTHTNWVNFLTLEKG